MTAPDPTTEFVCTHRRDAEIALRVLNGRGEVPKWSITEFDRNCVTHYCLTRADGSTDERATRAEIMEAVNA